eukprot:8754613-Pyramimonas_sp.AAC.1
MESEREGSEGCAASPMHRRCGSMWNSAFSTPTSPMHRRRRWCPQTGPRVGQDARAGGEGLGVEKGLGKVRDRNEITWVSAQH